MDIAAFAYPGGRCPLHLKTNPVIIFSAKKLPLAPAGLIGSILPQCYMRISVAFKVYTKPIWIYRNRPLTRIFYNLRLNDGLLKKIGNELVSGLVRVCHTCYSCHRSRSWFSCLPPGWSLNHRALYSCCSSGFVQGLANCI